MLRQIVSNFIAIVMLCVVQLSLINNLGAPYRDFNLVLCGLLFILLLRDVRVTIGWLLGCGLLLDIFSFLPFGVNLLGLTLAILLTYSLELGFFTNRSLYSYLGLIAFATLADGFFVVSLKLVFGKFSGNTPLAGPDIVFFRSLLNQLLLNGLAVILIFYLLNFISNRFRPVFLSEGKT